MHVQQVVNTVDSNVIQCKLVLVCVCICWHAAVVISGNSKDLRRCIGSTGLIGPALFKLLVGKADCCTSKYGATRNEA